MLSKTTLFYVVLLSTSLTCLFSMAGFVQAATYELDFSTYFGGTDWEFARDIFVDKQGYIYVVGGTHSTDFPTTPGAYDRTFDSSGTQVGSDGPLDAFISKFSPNGTLVWSTFLGGPNYDRAYAVEVDNNGYVYVAGRAGPGFPTTAGVFQPNFKGWDQGGYGWQNAFVAKLSPDGSNLLWASYVGLSSMCRDIAIDQSGNIYLPLGYNNQGDPASLPAAWFSNAFQNTTQGGPDCGIIKISNDGTQVHWATWLGGSGKEGDASSVRVDNNGYVYIGMQTQSTDIPTTPGVADRTYNGNTDYYVAKLSPDGSNLVFGTYLGGSGNEYHSTHNLAIDEFGNVYAAPWTDSSNYPTTTGAYQENIGSSGNSDIAVTKLSPTGGMIASTFIGGSGAENPDGIYVDASGNVYISGNTGSNNWPVTADAYQSVNGGSNDAILLILSADFSQLKYSTYMGGGSFDNATSGFMDSQGNLYIAGSSNGTGWPTKNAVQDHFAGGGGSYGAGDCILAKFSKSEPGLPSVAFSSLSSGGSEGLSPAALAVELSAPSAQTVTVDYSVTGGTATGGGVDYTLDNGTLTFSPGDITENVQMSIVDDSLVEGNETVVVTLSNPTNATLGTNATHTYTINDNDVAPTTVVEFTAVSSSGSEDVSPVALAVKLSPASPQTVTVDYSVTGGTATGGGVDYTVASGTLTFSSGDTTENVGITIVDDSAVEGNETVVVTLSNSVNATLGANASHTYTINDNDAAPTVEFVTTSSSGSETVSSATLPVNLSGASVQTVTVDYSVTGGTATGGGVDYTLPSGTLTFSPGDTTENVGITIVDDSAVEGDETVVVTLSNPVNATLGTNVSHTYTIINDYDETPPEISGVIPGLNSFQVARDTIIQMHITDSGSGVEYDAGTVTIQIEGDLIYDGANENPEGVYDSTASSQAVKGVCRRTGTAADYTFVFQPSTLFDYEQKVDVVVSATDKANNSMTQTYYFYTVMREFGQNVKVNSDTGTLIQDRPATATDSVGNIWVVWDQRTVAGDTDIYIGRIQAGSSTFGSSVQVAGGAHYQQNPAIAIHNDGTIHVVWQGDDLTGKWDIFVSTSVDGTSWSTPVKVNGTDPNNQSDQTSPAIAIDGNNKVYAVWEDNRAGNKDIWVGTSTDGTTWTNTQVATNASDQSEPSIAIDSDNVAYIVWTDARNLGTAGTDIYGAASDQGPWTNVPIVTTTGNQSSSGIASESSGTGLHLLWVDDASGNADIFYGATTDGFAATPLAGASIIDELDTIQAAPSIAVSGTGNTAKVFVCWQDGRNVVNNNGDIDIYFAEKGSDFGTNILVNDDAGASAQTCPVIGVDQNGSPYVAWVDNRSGNKDIYYAGATAIGPALPTTSTTIAGKTIVELNGANAGYVDDATDVLVEIPAGAMPSNIRVTISEVRNLPELPSGAFGVCYDFGPSGLQFSAPVTITIPHAADECPGLPIYRVYWYNTVIGAWSTSGITNVRHLDDTAPNVAPGIHAVQFDTMHLGIFGASAGAAPTGGGGGGGGGGGCSVSPSGEGSVAEFVLPYVVFVIVLLALSWADARGPTRKHDR